MSKPFIRNIVITLGCVVSIMASVENVYSAENVYYEITKSADPNVQTIWSMWTFPYEVKVPANFSWNPKALKVDCDGPGSICNDIEHYYKAEWAKVSKFSSVNENRYWQLYREVKVNPSKEYSVILPGLGKDGKDIHGEIHFEILNESRSSNRILALIRSPKDEHGGTAFNAQEVLERKMQDGRCVILCNPYIQEGVVPSVECTKSTWLWLRDFIAQNGQLWNGMIASCGPAWDFYQEVQEAGGSLTDDLSQTSHG